MLKPNNYDNVQTGDFVPVELGGHHMVIKAVEETTSKSGKPMLNVAFDFAQNDKQPGYFMDQFKTDIRPEKKWPYAGTSYIVSIDKDGNTSRNFKTFIKAFEDSNNVLTNWVDGEAFAAQFKNKKIGGVFGIVEDEYNGEVKRRHQLRWFCNDANAANAKIPNEKLLNTSSAPAGVPDQFVNVPSDTEEEIPF